MEEGTCRAKMRELVSVVKRGQSDNERDIEGDDGTERGGDVTGR